MGSFVQERAGELLTEPLFSRICKEIDNEVAVMEEDIRLFLSIITGTEYCRDGRMPVHYEWRASNCQFDFSGSLHPKGRISPRITLGDFLSEEYTGERKASYISGYGWSYPTYGDDLSYFTLAVGEQIMEQVLCRYVNFCTLSREEQYELRDEIHDIFYDNTLVNEFFWAESLFEPELGILDKDMPLIDFINIGRPYWKAYRESERMRLIKDIVPFYGEGFGAFLTMPRIV